MAKSKQYSKKKKHHKRNIELIELMLLPFVTCYARARPMVDDSRFEMGRPIFQTCKVPRRRSEIHFVPLLGSSLADINFNLRIQASCHFSELMLKVKISLLGKLNKVTVKKFLKKKRKESNWNT